MGEPKQLIRIGGETLLGRVVRAAAESDLERVVVVLGHAAERIRRALHPLLQPPKVQTVHNPDHLQGMSTSLIAGLAAVGDTFPALMVIPGDHPLLDADLINRVLAGFRRTRFGIFAPAYGGRRGFPVCFTARYYGEIRLLKGDVGARNILARHAEDLGALPVESDACIRDLDDRDDLQQVRAILNAACTRQPGSGDPRP